MEVRKPYLINGLSVYRININEYRYLWFTWYDRKVYNIHLVINNRVYTHSRYTNKYKNYIKFIMESEGL